MEQCISVTFYYKMRIASKEIRVCYKWHSVMRHKVVQHHMNDADILKVVENCGKIAIIMAVCPGCLLMKKIRAVSECPCVFSQPLTI